MPMYIIWHLPTRTSQYPHHASRILVRTSANYQTSTVLLLVPISITTVEPLGCEASSFEQDAIGPMHVHGGTGHCLRVTAVKRLAFTLPTPSCQSAKCRTTGEKFLRLGLLLTLQLRRTHQCRPKISSQILYLDLNPPSKNVLWNGTGPPKAGTFAACFQR